MNLQQKIRKLKRKILGNPKLRDKAYPTFWFQKVLGEQSAQIVQIGSNDGRVGDPLFVLLQKNQNWRSLFVEPVPYIFERLKANYPDTERFAFENSAVNQGEKLNFYWVDPAAKEEIPDLPFYYDQLGSFNRDHIVKALDGKLEPFILSFEIEGINLEGLLTKHRIEKIDILHIDVEGYDWEILQQLDLSVYQPKFILYEVTHLSKKARVASFDFLGGRYDSFRHKGDVLAVHRSVRSGFLQEIKGNMPAFNPHKKTRT